MTTTFGSIELMHDGRLFLFNPKYSTPEGEAVCFGTLELIREGVAKGEAEGRDTAETLMEKFNQYRTNHDSLLRKPGNLQAGYVAVPPDEDDIESDDDEDDDDDDGDDTDTWYEDDDENEEEGNLVNQLSPEENPFYDADFVQALAAFSHRCVNVLNEAGRYPNKINVARIVTDCTASLGLMVKWLDECERDGEVPQALNFGTGLLANVLIDLLALAWIRNWDLPNALCMTAQALTMLRKVTPAA